MTHVQICPECGIAATGAETEPKCRCCGTLFRQPDSQEPDKSSPERRDVTLTLNDFSPRALFLLAEQLIERTVPLDIAFRGVPRCQDLFELVHATRLLPQF